MGILHLKRGNVEIIQVIRVAQKIYFNPIVVGELLSGFKTVNQEVKNRNEFEAFLRSPRVEIIGLKQNTSERYAEILCYLKEKRYTYTHQRHMDCSFGYGIWL